MQAEQPHTREGQTGLHGSPHRQAEDLIAQTHRHGGRSVLEPAALDFSTAPEPQNMLTGSSMRVTWVRGWSSSPSENTWGTRPLPGAGTLLWAGPSTAKEDGTYF